MRHVAMFLFGLTGCANSLDVFDPDRSPLATIFEPSPNARLNLGSHTFLAQVADHRMEPSAVYVVWRLGDEEPELRGWEDACGNFAEADGTSRCTATLQVHHRVVRLVARNPAGFTRVVDVPVQVENREVPRVRWLAPLPPGPYYAGQPTELEIEVSHDGFPPEDLVLEWVGDRTGPIRGPSIVDVQGIGRASVSLPPGMNSLTVAATDPAGGRATATTAVLVRPPNEPPGCAIQSPGQDQGIELGGPVLLRGIAFDDETPAAALAVVWRSSRFGVLGRVEADGNGRVDLLVPGLSRGEHDLSLEVTDDGGATCVDVVTVQVGTAPQVRIDAPAAGATLTLGAPVTLQARVSDEASDPDAVLLRWFLDDAPVPGPASPDAAGDASITFSSLDSGARRLGVEAENTLGLTRRAEVQVTVAGP